MTLSTSQTSPLTSVTQFYTWRRYRCAYDYWVPKDTPAPVPLVLLHPIGVGLSRHFWQRFGQAWFGAQQPQAIYNPDLLGCGDSDMPTVAYHPIDWAEQLGCFLETVVKTPAVVVVQGALMPVAVDLACQYPNLIRGLVLSGPPAWPLISKTTPDWTHRVAWNLFEQLIGVPFYRYARRSQFLRSFSIRQLFAQPEAVDLEWLTMLQAGATDLASRHAVFAFLAGFWRQDYRAKMATVQLPTLIVMGDQATSISREGNQETPAERLRDYCQCFPNAQGVTIPGRNVLPYESTSAFVAAIAPFVQSVR